jgi:hypothetical protein
MLARHTNAYAQSQLTNLPELHGRRKSWRDTDRQEIKVFIALHIFQGYHRNSKPKSHWDTPVHDSPVHRIKYTRYKALMAFFKVSDIANDLDTTNTNDTKREDWHKKLSPLNTHLQERFQAIVIPGSRISYNEIIIGWRGRSIHTTKVPVKPQPDGFKCWAIGEKGYLYNWLYYSGVYSMSSLFYYWSVMELYFDGSVFWWVCIR